MQLPKQLTESKNKTMITLHQVQKRPYIHYIDGLDEDDIEGLDSEDEQKSEEEQEDEIDDEQRKLLFIYILTTK